MLDLNSGLGHTGCFVRFIHNQLLFPVNKGDAESVSLSLNNSVNYLAKIIIIVGYMEIHY